MGEIEPEYRANLPAPNRQTMKSTLMFIAFVAFVFLAACLPTARSEDPASASAAQIRAKLNAIPMSEKVNLTNEEWKKILTPEQYHIMREKGTELACSGALLTSHEKGVFVCAACGNPLFDSATKFESGTGWPSFFQTIDPDRVTITKDTSFGMIRDEVDCARCGSHLGHVFDDGPAPTHLRYCMNSLSLKLEKASEKK